MRQRAQQAGNLKSTQQETVTTQGQTIVIEPTDRKSFTCRNMILGSSTGAPRVSIQDGSGFRAPSSRARDCVRLGNWRLRGLCWGWHHLGEPKRPPPRRDTRQTGYISHSRTFIDRNNTVTDIHCSLIPKSSSWGEFPHVGGFPRAGGFPHPTGLVPAAELIMAAGCWRRAVRY